MQADGPASSYFWEAWCVHTKTMVCPYTDAHDTFIDNRQNLEWTKMSFSQ